jgi:hypothetical protein
MNKPISTPSRVLFYLKNLEFFLAFLLVFWDYPLFLQPDLAE